jgi:hypothetical protein
MKTTKMKTVTKMRLAVAVTAEDFKVLLAVVATAVVATQWS